MKFLVKFIVFEILIFVNLSLAYANNVYFSEYDFKAESPTGTLLVLKDFIPQQQTTDYTCGPVCVNMLINYYECKPCHSELEVAELMGVNKYTGTIPAKIEKYFKALGYRVQFVSKAYPMKSYNDFLRMVKLNLQKKQPILVENALWGNHWRIIIGLDVLEASNENDDVLIFADPMDVADGKQDGYTVVNARQFFYSWFSLNTPLKLRQGLIVERK